MSKPKAVVISDVHYDLNTLELADASMRQAINLANKLNVALVVAGDLHNSKANMRAECVNRMLKTFELCQTSCYILVGNHDKVNEKSEEHALDFLRNINNVYVIEKPEYCVELSAYFIPYQHDLVALDYALWDAGIRKANTLIMHQGITTAEPGEYTHDKTAVSIDLLAGFRVISGHYHARQDIGTASYIGNPYTVNFGEANHLPKGFRVLNEDGTLDFVPTNLRKHIVITHKIGESINTTGEYCEGDLVLAKVSGTKEDLSKFNREAYLRKFDLPDSTKIEFIPTESTLQVTQVNSSNREQSMDSFIDDLPASDAQKARLKHLWRHLCE